MKVTDKSKVQSSTRKSGNGGKLKNTKGVQVQSADKKSNRKAPVKKASPIGTKGMKKEIAKRPTKNKEARVPEMGNAGKIVFKRFGM